jgi:hypothetical protein
MVSSGRMLLPTSRLAGQEASEALAELEAQQEEILSRASTSAILVRAVVDSAVSSRTCLAVALVAVLEVQALMKSPDDHLLLLDQQTQGDQQRLGFKNFSFNFDSAAGIDYEVDVTKPDGEKVRILGMSNGEPFDENKWYKVAVNSYRGNGGGELLTRGAGIPKDSLESRIIWRSERDQRYYLMQEIEKMGTVDAKPNNNWRFVPEEWVKPAAERDFELLFKKK